MQKKETMSSQQSIERALKLLVHMGESRTGMNITEISKLLGISRSTTYAMINVMVEQNFLTKNTDGKYFLGYRLFMLGSASRVRYSSLYPCDDYLRNFIRQINLPLVRMGIWVLEQDYNVLSFITKTPTSDITTASYRRISPAASNAGGRMLLASLPEAEINKALSAQELRPYTPHTITDLSQIREQLKIIQHQGYAIDIEEFSNFEVNIAAPIKDYSGKTVATIVGTFSKMLYQNRPDDYLGIITGLGQEMSSILGYRGDIV